MDEKSVKRLEGLDELPPPAYSVVAVAISGSRRTKHVISWALDKFVPEGLVYFKLLHIRPLIFRIPTPSKFLPKTCFPYVVIIPCVKRHKAINFIVCVVGS